MLINTVILFLRDLLPLFILFCYLKLVHPYIFKKYNYLLITLIAGVLFSFYYFSIAMFVSELFEGAGNEILTVVLLILGYTCFVSSTLLASSSKKASSLVLTLLFIGINSIIAVKGSAFLIFLDVYLQQSVNWLNLLTGFVIGLGICISFASLFLFILKELNHVNQLKLIPIFWYLFLAGQVIKIMPYLSQVDLLPFGGSIIDLSYLVKDSSEYGHILNALFGYEASPSLTFLILYCLAFFLPVLGSFLISSKTEKRVPEEALNE